VRYFDPKRSRRVGSAGRLLVASERPRRDAGRSVLQLGRFENHGFWPETKEQSAEPSGIGNLDIEDQRPVTLRLARTRREPLEQKRARCRNADPRVPDSWPAEEGPPSAELRRGRTPR
jgi:hypothetical protein